MTDNAWFVVHLKLKYANMKIVYNDNTKNDFGETIEAGFRVLTELQSEVVEMRKMSTITQEERDKVLGHTCALDIEYYASGQSMGLCSAFAEIAPYSALARAGTVLIDGYWRGDFKTVDENLPILVEICDTRPSECDTQEVERVLYFIKQMQNLYTNTHKLRLSQKYNLGTAIMNHFSSWKRLDIYTAIPSNTINVLFDVVNNEEEEKGYDATKLLRIQTEKGSFATQITSPHHPNHTVQLNILRSSHCSTWHQMRWNCRATGVLSVKGMDLFTHVYLSLTQTKQQAVM